MIATVQFVRTTFDRFNALCFEGVLPSVPIVLTKAGTFLGKMEYKSRRDFFGIISSHYDFRLKISTGFDLPQEELEDVVIHEMIHYYIAYRNLSDTSVHGETFRRIMETVNQKYDRHITVRHHGDPKQNLVRDGSVQYRKHYLCVSTFSNGNRGITVCASTKIFELYRLLPKYYRISKMEWYGSIDPFFNRFPRANTPKIYKITEEELSEHLRDSIPLKCDGHTIGPV
ncbi:MAG: SprT-like domain-containing protein [Bacteroidales bacterium]|nr:SprT-like domain-containing protein [Candidatus Cryptobacteroides fimicaballi]